jgi:signal transduction histidine kinase/ligand-binding sensor domain-containing protein
MKQFYPKFSIQTILFLLFILLISCNKYKETPPFPYNENEYQQPKTKSFEFSKPDTLLWTTTKLKKLPVKKFLWDKIPSKPIDIGIPYALKKPLTTKPFDFESLPSTPFSLDSLPKKKLNIKIRVLGAPKIVKAGSAVIPPQSTRGVMKIDDNFGLPGNSYASIKDKDGMLWFGTANGIARYDSDNLEIYGADQGLNIGSVFSMLFDTKGRLWFAGDSRSISVIDFEANLVYEISSVNDYGRVYGIMEDNNGRIWYSNLDIGFNIVDLEEKWSRQINTHTGLLGTFTINPFQDKKGLIWLSTTRGINILDLKNGKNIKLTQENGLLNNFVGFFYEDRDGRLWISGGGGFNILNKNKTEISYLTAKHGFDGMRSGGEMFQDKNGYYWMGSVEGILFSYNEAKGLLERYILNNSNGQYVYNLLEDDQGQIWSSISQGGLYKIDLKTGKPGNFTQASGLSDNTIWSTLEAKDGKIWIGTNGGIDVYDPVKRTIKHLGTEQGLINNTSTTLVEDSKGNIWVGGNNVGLSIVDPVKETIQQITPKEGLELKGRIRSIFEDNKGVIWFGGNSSELLTIDLEKLNFKRVVVDSTKAPDVNASILEDTKNNIWVGSTTTGIQKIDPTNNTRFRLTTANGLSSDQVYFVFDDDQNKIWTATQKGVQLIDATEQKITTFTTEEGLAGNDVYDINQHKGEIFLGTSKGFTILKSINKEKDQPYWKVKSIGKKQGINEPDISQSSITFDRNGRLWAGGAGLQLIVMDEVIEDTIAYATAISGINIMDKKRFFQDFNQTKEKRAKIDTLWVNNKAYKYDKTAKDSSYFALNNIHWSKLKGPYQIPEDLVLPFDQNFLSFNFNGGQYANPDKVVYRYILEGIDKNWSPITKNTESENYRDLAPGNYNFKVASKDFYGVWSSPTEFQFSITPPWWQTWWAYTIFVVLFLGLGLVILHYRSQYLKNENRILEEKVNNRTAELQKTIEELENTQSQLIHSEKMASLGELTAGIAHEIQNPMNFITNFSEVSIELIDEMNEEIDKGEYDEAKIISKDIAENLDKITHHGKRASSIVKGMLEHSRNTSGIKELTDINVLADEYLRLSYHGLRAKNKSFNADFKTELDESLPKVEVVPQDLGRVILNLINNAFYAVTSIPEDEREANFKPLVTVVTKKMKDQILIKVKDNGPGISKEIKEKIFQPFFTTKPTGKGTGLGLSLAYDIITQGHGGAIELDTAPGKGTEFSIYIPL